MRGLAVYGSTGSIGNNVLNVVDDIGNFKVITLVCNENIDVMEAQIRKYNPIYAGMINREKAEELRERVRDTGTIVVSGYDESIKACVVDAVEIVVNSTVGISGLIPTTFFVMNKKNVGLANKESLVTAGELVLRLAAENGVSIAPVWVNGVREGPALLPIDSEHSAIWQCLQGRGKNSIKKIILTASGGPFKDHTPDLLRTVTKEEALNHPTWKMGGRITVDSATLMNKGFEIIEAMWLFGVKPENIEVVIHPKSIIHSMVQFEDNSILAQLGVPDMKLPIQYALTYPDRMENNNIPELDFTKPVNLELSTSGLEKFKCLSLARMAMERGGTAPAVLNGADERAVGLFLEGKITFPDIPDSIEHALRTHTVVKSPNLKQIITADMHARRAVDTYVHEKYGNKQGNKQVSKSLS